MATLGARARGRRAYQRAKDNGFCTYCKRRKAINKRRCEICKDK